MEEPKKINYVDSDIPHCTGLKFISLIFHNNLYKKSQGFYC